MLTDNNKMSLIDVIFFLLILLLVILGIIMTYYVISYGCDMANAST